MKNVYFYTQGCRLNQSETASIERGFEALGYTIQSSIENSDIAIVNTCTVTENGDADTRKLVRKINTLNPNTKIALIGCQSQVLKEKLLALENVKWVVGNSEKMNIHHIIASSGNEKQVIVDKIKREPFTIPTSSIDTKHTRANIKIQDGCDFYCAFCVIPFARGPARSRVYEDIIRECIDLASAGHQEIVITGINVGTYEYEGKDIVTVVKGISAIEGINRVRISSIEPTTIPLQLIDLMNTDSPLCRYLHIPIQSGSNDILKSMNRHYTTDEFRSFVTHAYNSVENICIGTDVIVGYPGETKAHFDETVSNLMTLPLHYFHVFSYSEREKARSKKLEDQIPAHIIKQRSKILRDISHKKRHAFYERFLGSEQWVLFEQEKNGYWSGLTDNFIRVKVRSEHSLKNRHSLVKFESIDGQSVLGRLIEG